MVTDSEADLKTIVTSLYRTYLRREPDPHGLSENIALLKKWGGLAGVGTLASVMERSTERALIDFMPTLVNWITTGNKSIDKLAGRPVISLGSHCAPTMILKINGLRQFSSPFDWIFSSPAMVRHCISDRFAIFLGKDFHRRSFRPNHLGKLEAVSEHLYYQSEFSITGPIFNHKDVTSTGDFNYYVRNVERFISLIETRVPVQFLQCVVSVGHTSQNCIDEFRATADLLSVMAPETSLAMFSIRETLGILPEVKIVDERAKHRLFQLDTTSTLETLDFAEKIDQIALLGALRWHARTEITSNGR